MKKFFLALLAVVCLACLGIAGAACTSAKYYTLYFNTVEGANVVCEIPSGYEVKEGYRVVFQVELDGDAHGTPVVAVNGDTVEADNNGFYSFKMKRDTTVTVTGVTATGRHAVIFDKGGKDNTEYRVTYKAEYVDENGGIVEIDTDEKDGTPLKEGTEVSFTVGVSVYYGENPKFDVLENTQVIYPEADGKYHVKISQRVTVSIQGLELDDSFVGRKSADGKTTYVDGAGTRENPYKVKKPIDLYVMASLVNSEFFYTQTGTAYYSLENDIDLKNEELFIIGASNEFYFGGDFNGNGHTVSNYYISANAVDQDSYEKGFMPNIGLFGVAAGAKIYDLNLANFSYDIDAAPWEEGFFAGGVVAYGVGVEITNCSVSGSMRLTADTNRFGYAGGIIGYMMSAYDQPSNTRYYATVRSCSTNVNIVGRAGYIYGAGGIAGNIGSSDESTTAMIINCYATGNVSGAMRTGGIAGAVASYGSVINCYATGYVDANNRLGNDPEFAGFRYAYSGGIAGELECDAIIANCFFAGDATAIAAAGQNYASSGDIAGSVALGGMEGGAYIHAERGIIYNCAPDEDGGVDLEDIDNNYIKTILKWSDGDWTFNESGYPAVNAEDGSNSFKITVNLKNGTIGGKTAIEQNVSDAYIPMSYWYVYADSNLDEYLSEDTGLRSFGYYFDENLTLKVPSSYVPVHEITLWTAFADYSEVSGKYYLQWTQNGSGKYLELKDDGTLIYRDGALTCESYYYYDGEYITLRDTYIALIDGLSNGAYTSFKATVENGVMTVWDNKYYPENSSVKAVKEEANFGYGKYYGSGVEYVFNTDGTGVYTSGENRRPFTFTVNGGSIKIELNGSTINETLTGGKVTEINGVALTHYDWFEGVWEKSAGSHKEYTFDGKGGWSYVYYGYDNNGAVVAIGSPVTGTYTVSGNEIDLNNGTKFTVDGGVLSLGNEVYYYKQYSYAGVWSNIARQFAIEITLDGITAEGYGKANINYGAIYGSYDLTYDVKFGNLSVKTGVDEDGKDVFTTYENKQVIRLYNGDVLIATLAYFEASRTLWGGVYQISTGETEAMTFYLYDDFKGDWISGSMDVTFNGLGNYDVAGIAGILPVKGEVKVNGVSAGAYTLVNNTLTGSFQYSGGTYNISYNEASGKINVTGAGSFDLERRDEWYGIKLIDGSGNVYSFDGRGNLTGGGTMTVTPTSGPATTQNYNGSTITVSGNVYKYGATTLYLYNSFTGTWYVSGTYGQTLVIGNFGADNSATGSYLGQSYTFTYHRDGNYVTLADPAHPELLPLYINVLDGGDVVELAVARANNTQDLECVCVKTNSDGYEGDYVNGGDGGTLTLDGLGKCAFTDGSAKYVKGGTVVEQFTYIVDEFNQVLLLSLTDGKYHIFSETAGGAYAKDGKSYAMALPDNLYTVKANLTVGGENVLVAFYGNGKAVASNGSVYSYEINKHNTTLMEYLLTMTLGGETKSYVLDYNTDYDEAEEIYYVLTVVDALYGIQATLGDNVVTFRGNGTADCSDGSVYQYAISSYDSELKVYRLTITIDGKNANYALDCSTDYDPDNDAYYALAKL